MTGEIIKNGTTAFSSIVDKLGNITTEFVPYLIYIAIAILGISLTINVVKYILAYLKMQSEDPFGVKRFKNYDGPINVEKPRERYEREDYLDQQEQEKKDEENFNNWKNNFGFGNLKNQSGIQRKRP